MTYYDPKSLEPLYYQEDMDLSYNDGFNAGYEAGRVNGYREGYRDGLKFNAIGDVRGLGDY